MDRAVIVADDLTGAAELAAFAGTTERPARVAWVHRSGGWGGDGGTEEVSSIVIDTESRNLTEGEGRARLAAVVRRLRPEWRSRVVYKKIDSTLRGPIRAEITLLHDVAGLGPVLAAPAYPRMGRTTRGGVQYLHGVAVADGPAGDDPVAAARESEVARLLPPGDHVVLSAPGGREARDLASELSAHRRAGRHVVVDAELERDLERVAEALRSLPPGLLVGTGGLARHLWPPKELVAVEGHAGRIVVIVGSHHPAAREQALRLQRVHACRRVGLVRDENTRAAATRDAADRGDDPREGPYRDRPPKEHLDEVLVLTTPSHRVEPEVALRDLDRALEEVIALGVPSALVVTGGESALHVLECVGATSLAVVGELVDGLPIGHIVGGAWAGTLLATKAGGFGGPDVLAHAVERLRAGVTSSA
jgi:D-threonate/D-erythronate kinase